MLNIKEKAPDGLPTNQSASEINQVQDTTDWGNCQEPVDPVIPELIEMVKRINELFKSHGVLSVGGCGEKRVQIYGDGSLFDLFSFGKCQEEYVPGTDKYSATVDGVEFFCLVEKGSEKCTAQ